jgi:cell cycle arrest protein BUB2
VRVACAFLNRAARKGGEGIECSLRGKVWKVLLGVSTVDAGEYVSLVGLGRSAKYDDICKDTARTFKSDPQFRSRVTETKMNRVLNVLDHWGASQV